MSKDNTLLYVGLGLAVVYFFTKKSAAPAVYTPGYTTPVNNQATQPGMILPIVTKLATNPSVVNAITNLFKGTPAPATNPAAAAADNQAAQSIFATPPIGPAPAPAASYSPGNLFQVPALTPAPGYTPVSAYVPPDSAAPIDMTASYTPIIDYASPSPYGFDASNQDLQYS